MRLVGSCIALLALAGCTTSNGTTAKQSSADAFFAVLSSYCGKAFSGRLTSNDPVDADMRGVPLVMHVRNCSGTEIRVPFHVGKSDGSWDRSRTWVITRTPHGLRLKHDHRHEDGTPDKVTMYGGNTASLGTAQRQEFPVNAESVELFKNSGLGRSITNIWAVEVSPGTHRAPNFAYELRRVGENDRFFRVEFDLGKPVLPPAAPWGGS